MKKRALTTLLIVVMAAFSVTGCASGNGQNTSNEGNTAQKEEAAQQPSDSSKEDQSSAPKSPAGITADSPEEFMEKYIRTYLIDRTQDVSTIWENCVSERTKSTGLISEQDYVNPIKQALFRYKYTDVLVINEGEVQENIYKLTVTFKVVQGNIENSLDEVCYVINENGNYRLLLRGITDVIYYSPESSEESDFELKDLKALITPDGITFSYELVNHSDQSVYLGPWASDMTIFLTMDDGQVYSTSYSHMVTITPNNSDPENPFFEGASGTPAELKFDTITYLKENGMPESTTSYTVDLN